MTAVPGEASRAVLKWPGVEPLPVQPLDGDEARAIAEGICARYHRTLEAGVLDALLAKKGPDGFAWATPLWLVLAVEELNVLDADDFSRAKRTYSGSPAHQLEALMVDMVAAMPPDALELYRSTFDRAEELFGPHLTRAFLGSIAVSRAGGGQPIFETCCRASVANPGRSCAWRRSGGCSGVRFGNAAGSISGISPMDSCAWLSGADSPRSP